MSHLSSKRGRPGPEALAWIGAALLFWVLPARAADPGVEPKNAGQDPSGEASRAAPGETPKAAPSEASNGKPRPAAKPVAKDKAPPSNYVPMTIKLVARNNLVQSCFVVLQNEAKDRFLDVYIGQSEAYSIALGLRGEPAERPMTHDLMAEMVERLGGRIVRSAVTEVRDNTFFGEITVLKGETKLVFDARPSDAVAVSLRARTPIYVEKNVLKESGHDRDYEKEGLIRKEEEEGEEAEKDGSAAEKENPKAAPAPETGEERAAPNADGAEKEEKADPGKKTKKKEKPAEKGVPPESEFEEPGEEGVL